MRMQPDGKLVVGGSFKENGKIGAFLQRLNCNGSVDTTFNQGAVFSFRVDNETTLLDFALQTDGRIVATGYSRKGNRIQPVVFRVLANGALDTSFGPGRNGYNNEPLDTSGDPMTGEGLRILGDQTVSVLVGVAGTSAGFASYSPSGTLRSFRRLTSPHSVQPQVLASNDSLYWGGACSGSDPLSCGFLARYTDPVVINANRAVPQALVALSSDRILAIGSSQTGSDGPQATVSRHLSDLSLDPAFGQGGTATAAPRHAWFNGGQVQADGRIVAAGATQASSNSAPEEFLVRFLPDGSPDSSFTGMTPSTSSPHGSSNAGAFLDSVLTRDGFLFVQGCDLKDDRVRVYRFDASGNRN